MYASETDFFGRLRSFMEMFGPGGLLILIIAAAMVIAISLWKGAGLTLFVLFICYSLGALSRGGITYAATLARWGCLGLLGIGFFKRFSPPRASMCLFVVHVVLGFLFIGSSTFYIRSLQQSILLAMTVLCVYIAVSGYVTSPDKIGRIFKMGIIAGTVWVLVTLPFIQEFRYSVELRFASAVGMGGVATAYAGAFFAPMIIWGIIQKRSKMWRIYSALLIMPFVFVLLMGAVRSAIMGMLIIGSLPILFLKVKPTRFIVLTLVIGILLSVSVYALFLILPTKAEFLVTRLLAPTTSRRFEVWIQAFNYCVVNSILGHGIGSSSFAGATVMGMLFHNAYLQIWYDTGIIGILAVLLFLFVYLQRSFRLVFKSPTEETAEYSRIVLGYMLGLAAMGLVEGVFASAGGMGTCMLMVSAALIDQLDRMSSNEFLYDFTANEEFTVDDWQHLEGDIYEQERQFSYQDWY